MCCDNCRPVPSDAACTCGIWMSILPPPPCPAHGPSMHVTITNSTVPVWTGTNSK